MLSFADGNCETVECFNKSAAAVSGPGAPAAGATGGGQSQADHDAGTECNHWGKLEDLN